MVVVVPRGPINYLNIVASRCYVHVKIGVSDLPENRRRAVISVLSPDVSLFAVLFVDDVNQVVVYENIFRE